LLLSPEVLWASACGRREVAAVQTIENKNKIFREASCAVAKRIWLVAIAGRKERETLMLIGVINGCDAMR
jgi:hypothetical protein